MKLNLFIKLILILAIADWSGVLVLVKMRMRIVLDDYESDYDIQLRKRGKVIMKIKRLGVLANEVFITVNNLNPNYMKDISTPKLHPKVRPNDDLFKHHNICGAKRIRCKKNKTLGPKIWSQLHTVQKE